MILKFLQWNVYYLEKIERVLQFLQQVDADILCLQELCTNSTANPGVATGPYLAERLQYHSHIETTQSFSGRDSDSSQNGILSRFPLSSMRSVFLIPPCSSDCGDYSKEGRLYLEATVETEIGPIKVGTTHLSYTHRFSGSELKIKEVSNLLNCLSATDRFILSGDFNATPESSLIRQLRNRLSDCGPDESEKTWTTKEFNYNGFRESELAWRLDYVFCSRDLKVRRSEILKTNVSDHLPILVEFEL